ncbi:MAG: hypothetical protein ACU0CO_01265 [Shimia sp.]
MGFETLKSVEVIVGLILAVGGVLMVAFRTWESRIRSGADSRVQRVEDKLDRSSGAVEHRLGKVEAKVSELGEEVHRVKETIASLPSSQDVTELKVAVAKQGVQLEGLQGMVRTMYQAAVRASEDP